MRIFVVGKMRNVVKAAYALGLSFAVLGGCGKDNASGASGQPTPHEPFSMRMYFDDLHAIQVDPSSERNDDWPQKTSDAFVSFFGAQSGDAVRAYINERIRHVVTFTKVSQAEKNIPPETVSKFKYTKYSDLDLTPGRQAEAEKLTAAFNVGTGAWFGAKVNDIDDFSLTVDEEILTFDSSRVGVIAVPDDYLFAMDPTRSIPAHITQLIRQATLVHEARHSDCTGGLLEATLESARKATNYASFARDSDLKCGHIHALCPSGDFAGLPACDKHAWGSYTAGYLFLKEMAKRSDLSSREKNAMDTIAIGQKERLLFNAYSMMSGRMGPPDLSHSDEVIPAKMGGSKI